MGAIKRKITFKEKEANEIAKGEIRVAKSNVTNVC